MKVLFLTVSVLLIAAISVDGLFIKRHHAKRGDPFAKEKPVKNKLPSLPKSKRSGCAKHITLEDMQAFSQADFAAGDMSGFGAADDASRCNLLQSVAPCIGDKSVPTGKYCYNDGTEAVYECNDLVASRDGDVSCEASEAWDEEAMFE